MTDPHEVIAEARPMLEDFLQEIGVYCPGMPMTSACLRDQFSDWIDAQTITEDDFGFLSARVAAFICEFLIEAHGAQRVVRSPKIFLRLPVNAAQGVFREFDPYAVAVDLVRGRKSLKAFLSILVD